MVNFYLLISNLFKQRIKKAEATVVHCPDSNTALCSGFYDAKLQMEGSFYQERKGNFMRDQYLKGKFIKCNTEFKFVRSNDIWH